MPLTVLHTAAFAVITTPPSSRPPILVPYYYMSRLLLLLTFLLSDLSISAYFMELIIGTHTFPHLFFCQLCFNHNELRPIADLLIGGLPPVDGSSSNSKAAAAAAAKSEAKQPQQQQQQAAVNGM